MIKRINTLKNVGRFSELRSDSGEAHDFSELNVVYASNASGKSTFCDILRSLSLDDPAYVVGRRRLGSDADPEVVIGLDSSCAMQVVRFQHGSWVNASVCPAIHVYDDRFVSEHVLVGHHINVDQRRNLYGLVIGSAGIALKEAVDLAEVDLKAAGQALDVAKVCLDVQIPSGYNTESFREVPAVADIDDQIEIAEHNLKNAQQTKSKADSIRQRAVLQPVAIPVVPTSLGEVLSTSLDRAASEAERRIKEHLEEHSNGLNLDWVGQGQKARTGDGCPLCGQSMSELEIAQSYNAFFSGELQAQERARSALRSEAKQSFGEAERNRIREVLISHITEQDWWSDAAGFKFILPDGLEVEVVQEAHAAVFEAIIAALDRKTADPGSEISLSLEEQRAIDTWETKVAFLVGYNGCLEAINDKLIQRKEDAGSIDLVPFQEALESLQASKSRHQQALIDAFKDYDEAVLAKSVAQRAKQKANEDLRIESNESFSRYGARINELLERFATNFRIVSGGSNDSYVSFSGGQPSGMLAIELLGERIPSSPSDAANPAQPSLANTLSGGDRSALALAFFLAKVELDTNVAECIAVFDDPYHNQDRSRQSRTIERIHHLSRQAKQCFVFSHDLDFARAVALIHGVDTRTFVLAPLQDRTTLRCQELPMLPSRAYEVKYTELTSFIETPANYSDRLNLIACSVRTILEEYLQLKFPLRWTGQDYWFGTMIGEIRNATGDDPLVGCQGLVDDLTQVNEYSQRFHHRTTGATADVPDPRELVDYAKQTLCIIHK